MTSALERDIVGVFQQISKKNSAMSANSAHVSKDLFWYTKLIPSFQIRSSLVPGQALPTATSPVEQKGSGWRPGLALPSAQTFPPTFPAKTNSLSEQETWGALQAVSTAQVNWAKKTETDFYNWIH